MAPNLEWSEWAGLIHIASSLKSNFGDIPDVEQVLKWYGYQRCVWGKKQEAHGTKCSITILHRSIIHCKVNRYYEELREVLLSSLILTLVFFPFEDIVTTNVLVGYGPPQSTS